MVDSGYSSTNTLNNPPVLSTNPLTFDNSSQNDCLLLKSVSPSLTVSTFISIEPKILQNGTPTYSKHQNSETQTQTVNALESTWLLNSKQVIDCAGLRYSIDLEKALYLVS